MLKTGALRLIAHSSTAAPLLFLPNLLLNSHSSRAGKDPELGPDSSYPPWVFDLAQPAPSRQVQLQRCQRAALHHVSLTSPHLTSSQELSKATASAISTQQVFQVRAQCFPRPRPPRLLPPAQFLRLERRADIKLSNSATSKK